MITWSCSVENTAKLTVGAEFKLRCKGDASALKQDSWLAVIGGEVPAKYKKFALQILRHEKISDQETLLHVTSYVAAEHKIQNLQFSDGNDVVVVDTPLQFAVQTVVKPVQPDPNAAPEEQKAQAMAQPTPYPVYGPVSLSISWYYWLVWILILFFIGRYVYHKIKMYLQKKQLIQNLTQYRTVLSPFDQFYKELRQLERQYPQGVDRDPVFLQGLYDAICLFLIRELEVPAFDWSAKEILAELKKNHRHIDVEKELVLFAREINQGRKAKSVTAEDCVHLTQFARQIVDTIHQQTERRRKK